MKEPYEEGVAIHFGPESCVGPRKGSGEALTGVRASRTLSPEIPYSRECQRCSPARLATPATPLSRGAVRTPRGLRIRARTETLRAGIGRSWYRPRAMVARSASGIRNGGIRR